MQTKEIEILFREKTKFTFVFALTFLLSFAFLTWLDFVPEPVKGEKVNKDETTLVVVSDDSEAKNSDTDINTTKEENYTGLLPEKITFDTLDKTVSILNPVSKSVGDLDHALLSGVVRHPDSATLGQEGTVFILGHSSYLPHVINPNFQAFNDIQKLKWGDVITLEADSKAFIYRVDKVYKAKATDTTVPIASQEKRLILATCNSFGTVDDRYIVEANFVEVRKI